MRATTGISLLAELKRAAERQAKREHRSLSSLISFALARYLREVGAWEESRIRWQAGEEKYLGANVDEVGDDIAVGAEEGDGFEVGEG